MALPLAPQYSTLSVGKYRQAVEEARPAGVKVRFVASWHDHPGLVAAFADTSRSPYHLIALAVGAGTFYGDFRNRVGGTHLGFPGPSDGYLSSYTDRTGHGQPQADAVPA